MMPFLNEANNNSVNYVTQMSNSFAVKIDAWEATELYFDQDTECWTELIDGGCNMLGGEHLYLAKHGGPYYNCEN